MSAQTFNANISSFIKKANGNAALIVKKIVFDLGNRVVYRSPVGDRELWAVNIHRAGKGLPPVPKGYVGGRFRGNWQYGFGVKPAGNLATIDPSGAVSLSRIAAGVQSMPTAGIHYLVNNLPYAKRLEDGWSTQAPHGMVGLTVAEFTALVREAAKA